MDAASNSTYLPNVKSLQSLPARDPPAHSKVYFHRNLSDRPTFGRGTTPHRKTTCARREKCVPSSERSWNRILGTGDRIKLGKRSISRNGNNRAAFVTFFAGPPRFANFLFLFLWNTAVVASPPTPTPHCSTLHLKASHTEGSTHQARLSLPPLHSSLFSQHIGCCSPISNKKQDHPTPKQG